MDITPDIEIQLFEEFIQFAFNEFYISRWRERMNELRCGEYNYIIYGIDDSKIIYMLTTIPELLNAGHDYKQIIMAYKSNLTSYLWFQSWISKRFPNTVFFKKGFKWEIETDFKNFVKQLSVDDLIEIINSEIMIK